MAGKNAGFRTSPGKGGDHQDKNGQQNPEN